MTAATAIARAPARSAITPDGVYRHYALCGGVLRSALEFPELPAIDAAEANWAFEVRDHPAPVAVDPELLGEREIGAERYRLFLHRDGLRLEYSHAGCFDVSRDGRQLSWYRLGDAPEELARAIALGPAIALALELSGALCLHGSAVAVDGKAVAFLGGKYHGKSTLATALTAAGARLISDDMLVVVPGAPPRLRAGVPGVRLWEDSATHLDVAALCERVLPGVKTTAVGFSGRVADREALPLAAIYLLDPVPQGSGGTEGAACWRAPVRGASAAIALAHQTKLPPNLVGAARAGAQLQRAAATAAAVPVWKLGIVRDFSSLPDATRQIMAWHSAGADAP